MAPIGAAVLYINGPVRTEPDSGTNEGANGLVVAGRSPPSMMVESEAELLSDTDAGAVCSGQ